MKILVIDDEKTTLSMFKLFLTAYGYEVHTAEDGEQGLSMFERIKPDIVFTDIKMPGIDGLEVLRRMRKTPIDAEVIVITGHGDMEKVVEALDLDASDFINKPVERRALNSALARAEKRRHLSRHQPFAFTRGNADGGLTIRMQGKLTAGSGSILSDFLNDVPLRDSSQVIFRFEEGFSIDRSGITLLLTVLKELKQKEVDSVMENLSYNYARIFQMAGVDRYAVLRPSVMDD